MQAQWLKQGTSSDLIVFFGGWAVGVHVLSAMPKTHDILFVEDYRKLDFILPDLSQYRDTSLMAWSFGVASYAHWVKRQGGDRPVFKRQIALCGSLDPVSLRKGIPPRAFKATRDGLSIETYQTFLANSFGIAQDYRPIDVAARCAELDAVAARGAALDPGFDRIWIASDDKIFPSGNLERAWAGKETRLIAAPHVPFGSFETWEHMWA